MNLDQYQNEAFAFAQYPKRKTMGGLLYTSLGLAGECGEFCDKVKKILRDKGGVIDTETKEALSQELGDVLWYVSQCAQELNLNLSLIAYGNINKLSSRLARGKIGGSGDNR
jgi:NTP pyrophosphatase (non-canonical NTP hydrolase)